MDKDAVNKIAGHPIQSFSWGQFRAESGNEVVFSPYGLLTLHKIPLLPCKIGMFLKGPKPTKEMLGYLKTLAQEKNLIFIKLEPNFVPENKKGRKQIISLLQKEGCVSGKRLFTPTTFYIDLTRSEEELLRGFHPKTRYNIRVAQKNGVEVIEDNSQKAFNKYISLTRETVERQGFYAHTEAYHRLMWKHLEPAGIAHLLTARYKGKIITTWIVFAWKDFLYYPYGASTEEHKNVMANNLMMWEAIRFGRRLGLKTFDLWGREEGKGFTRFKEGYNPKVVEFLGSWDLVTSPLYWPYRFSESLRWAILRFRSKFIKPSF
jgi:lipid II:glycine glycyltransferase (peptidoglycan interpeptide bridge formation enzyme)